MSKLLIKIQGETFFHQHMTIEGMGGKAYVFKWDKNHRAYIFTPQCQQDIDDLFATQGVGCARQIAPLVVEGETSETMQVEPANRIPPFLSRKEYESRSVGDLVELCRHNGFAPLGTDKTNLLAQLDAYFAGRAWNRVETSAPDLPVPAKPARRKPAKPSPTPAETEAEKAETPELVDA